MQPVAAGPELGPARSVGQSGMSACITVSTCPFLPSLSLTAASACADFLAGRAPSLLGGDVRSNARVIPPPLDIVYYII